MTTPGTDPATATSTADPITPPDGATLPPEPVTPPDGATSTADPITPSAGRTPAPAGDYRVVVVASVALDLPDQHPVVVLQEAEPPRRRLSFAVGLQDGVALAQALRRLPTPRPLTHELTADVLHRFDIDVVAVRLVGRQGSTYFAELDLRGPDRRSVLSCRPSDALAIALRQQVTVPVLADVRLFEQSTDVLPG